MTVLDRTTAKVGVIKGAKSKGYFSRAEAVGTKRVPTPGSHGG